MRRVLGIAAFRRVAAASLLNELALLLAEIALALLVFHRTGSAIGATAFFLCAQFVPAFVSPFVVAQLDQSSARRTIALLYAMEILVFLLLAQTAKTLAVPLILLLALVKGSLATSARVLARAAWTSVTTATSTLRDANAVLNSAASVTFLAGPAIGGGLVALGGTTLPLYINACLLALCVVAVSMAKDLPPAAQDRVSVIGRLRSAVRYAGRNDLLRRLLPLQGVFAIFFTISIPVEVVLVRHTLHATAGGYGLLLSGWGGGAIAGSLIYARWRGFSSRVLMTLGAALVGVGYLPMALAPNLAVAIVGAVIAGVGNGIEVVAMRTALQESVPLDWMALILSVNESMFQAVPGIGIVAGGAITALAGPRVALSVGAAGALAVALAMWMALPSSEAGSAVAASERELDEQSLSLAARRP
jgi:MFS family permease